MRLRLAQAAAIGNPALTVSRVEIERPGPSYMVDTLRELAQRYPGNGLVLLLGSDQYAALSTWHEPERVAQLARIAVAPPAGRLARRARRCRRRAHRDAAGRHLLVDDPRARGRGRPIRHLVPDPVRELIEAEGLYRWELPCSTRGKVTQVRYRDWSRLLSRGHELADRIAAICSDKLAEDVVILDMEDVVGYTDAFVICSGQNARHVAGHRRGSGARPQARRGPAAEGRRGPSRGRLDPARLPRRGPPRLHARSARLLPPGQLWGQVPQRQVV